MKKIFQFLSRLSIYPLGLIAVVIFAAATVWTVDKALKIGSAIQSGEWREWSIPGLSATPTVAPTAGPTMEVVTREACPNFYEEWDAQPEHPVIVDGYSRVPKNSTGTGLLAYCDSVYLGYQVDGENGKQTLYTMRYEYDGEHWIFAGEHCEYNC